MSWQGLDSDVCGLPLMERRLLRPSAMAGGARVVREGGRCDRYCHSSGICLVSEDSGGIEDERLRGGECDL